MALPLAFLTILVSAIAGGAVAWARSDLRIRPAEAALGGGGVTAGAVALWLTRPEDPAILPLFAGLGPLVWIDLRRHLLPDPLTLPLIAAGVLIGVLTGRGGDAVLGAAVGYAVFRLVGLGWERWRSVDALGHGDAKLLAAIGAFLGPWLLPQVVLIAALAGISFALLTRAATGRDEIAFGPPLAAAAAVTWVTGALI